MTPTELLWDLERCPYFKGIDQDVLHAIAVLADTVRYRDGRVIANRGEPATCMWLLTDGSVEVLGPGPDGAPVVRARLRPGMLIGHVELLAGERRAATWTAKGSARLLAFDRPAFDRLIGDPSIIGSTFRRALILAQTNQLIAANRRLSEALEGAGTASAERSPSAPEAEPWTARES